MNTHKTEEDKKHVEGKSHGWIQWKGTEVCIDLTCIKCGWNGHFDGDFLYFMECPGCHTIYAVGEHVLLHELTSKEDIEYAKNHCLKKPILD